MNDVVAGLVRLLVRVALVAAGLVMFASLLLAALVLALSWGLRAAWARITGRPVTPWVMRMDPRRGWSAVYRHGQARWGGSGAAPGRADAAAAEGAAPGARTSSVRTHVLPGADQGVTDVQPRAPSAPRSSH